MCEIDEHPTSRCVVMHGYDVTADPLSILSIYFVFSVVLVQQQKIFEILYWLMGVFIWAIINCWAVIQDLMFWDDLPVLLGELVAPVKS